jgi:hypothetical protein
MEGVSLNIVFERVKYMMRKSRCCRGVLGVLFAWIGTACTTAPDVSRPNVIIVITDDQGSGDLSCHGNPVLKTPNLDNLFTQGVGRAVPIEEARLKVGADVDVTKPTPGGQTEVSFEVTLQAGQTRLSTWFYDQEGQELCSAF